MKDKTDKVTQELPLEDDDSYTVYYKGLPTLRLNARLIIQQGLSKDAVENIKVLHRERLSIEEDMEKCESNKRLKYLFEEWTQNQYSLQKLWGFPEDANFHPSHRLSVCTCAKIDNDERLGTLFRVITNGCPIHDNRDTFK